MTLRLQNISHTYHSQGLADRTIIQPLPQLELAAGSQVLLRGISGSGKTTLLNILSGLLPPTAGQVLLNGQSLYALAETARDRYRNQQIGYIFQAHHLLPMLTAVENIAMPLAFAGVGQKERQQQAHQWLKRIGLAEFAGHRPAQLSMGQRLRIAVARALVNQPALLLADEPTAALDTTAATDIMQLVQESCHQQQTILIVASHDPALETRFAQQWHIENGQIRG